MYLSVSTGYNINGKSHTNNTHPISGFSLTMYKLYRTIYPAFHLYVTFISRSYTYYIVHKYLCVYISFLYLLLIHYTKTLRVIDENFQQQISQ